MTIGIIWFVLALAVGVFATSRGRGSGTWFLLSLVISPLLGLVALLGSTDLSKPENSPRTHVKCSSCAEPVLREAVKCKHCGADLAPQPYDGSAAQKLESQKTLIVGGIILALIFGAYLTAKHS